VVFTWPSRNRTFGLVDALGIVGIAGLLVARFVPVAHLPFWGCVLREQTGWPCLGCGLTRVADRVSHGNLLGAWDANPLGTIAACLFVLAAVWMVVHLGFGIATPSVELSRRESWMARGALVLAVLVNYTWVVLKVRFPEVLAVLP
jgi:hypothetical protein